MASRGGKSGPRRLFRGARWRASEWARVRRRARRRGLSCSGYLRQVALGEPPAVPVAWPEVDGVDEGEELTLSRGTRWRPSEWRIVEEKAALAGLSPTRFIRRLCLGHRLVGRVDAQAVRQLSGLGNNLNQLTRIANATGRVKLGARLESLLAELERTVVGLLE